MTDHSRELSLPRELRAIASPLVALLSDGGSWSSLLSRALQSANAGAISATYGSTSLPSSPFRIRELPLHHDFPTKQRSHSGAGEYETYVPLGILRSNWLNKHHNDLPGLVVIAFEMDVRASPAEWSTTEGLIAKTVTSLRSQLRDRLVDVHVVLSQDSSVRGGSGALPPPPPTVSGVLAAQTGPPTTSFSSSNSQMDPRMISEIVTDRIGSLRRRAGLDAGVVSFLFSADYAGVDAGGPPSPGIINLEEAIRQRTMLSYTQQKRRLKAVVTKTRWTLPQQAGLKARLFFKMAQLSEFRGRPLKALKYYLASHSVLCSGVASASPLNLPEFKTVAAYVNIKAVTHMLLFGHSVLPPFSSKVAQPQASSAQQPQAVPAAAARYRGSQAAVTQFNIHMRCFDSTAIDSSLLFDHHAWKQRQYVMMAELLQTYLPRPGATSWLPCVPSLFYESAATCAVNRRRAAEEVGILVAPPVDPPFQFKEETQEEGSSAVPSASTAAPSTTTTFSQLALDAIKEAAKSTLLPPRYCGAWPLVRPVAAEADPLAAPLKAIDPTLASINTSSSSSSSSSAAASIASSKFTRSTLASSDPAFAAIFAHRIAAEAASYFPSLGAQTNGSAAAVGALYDSFHLIELAQGLSPTDAGAGSGIDAGMMLLISTSAAFSQAVESPNEASSSSSSSSASHIPRLVTSPWSSLSPLIHNILPRTLAKQRRAIANEAGNSASAAPSSFTFSVTKDDALGTICCPLSPESLMATVASNYDDTTAASGINLDEALLETSPSSSSSSSSSAPASSPLSPFTSLLGPTVSSARLSRQCFAAEQLLQCGFAKTALRLALPLVEAYRFKALASQVVTKIADILRKAASICARQISRDDPSAVHLAMLSVLSSLLSMKLTSSTYDKQSQGGASVANTATTATPDSPAAASSASSSSFRSLVAAQGFFSRKLSTGISKTGEASSLADISNLTSWLNYVFPPPLPLTVHPRVFSSGRIARSPLPSLARSTSSSPDVPVLSAVVSFSKRSLDTGPHLAASVASSTVSIRVILQSRFPEAITLDGFRLSFSHIEGANASTSFSKLINAAAGGSDITGELPAASSASLVQYTATLPASTSLSSSSSTSSASSSARAFEFTKGGLRLTRGKYPGNSLKLSPPPLSSSLSSSSGRQAAWNAANPLILSFPLAGSASGGGGGERKEGGGTVELGHAGNSGGRVALLRPPVGTAPLSLSPFDVSFVHSKGDAAAAAASSSSSRRRFYAPAATASTNELGVHVIDEPFSVDDSVPVQEPLQVFTDLTIPAGGSLALEYKVSLTSRHLISSFPSSGSGGSEKQQGSNGVTSSIGTILNALVDKREHELACAQRFSHVLRQRISDKFSGGQAGAFAATAGAAKVSAASSNSPQERRVGTDLLGAALDPFLVALLAGDLHSPLIHCTPSANNAAITELDSSTAIFGGVSASSKSSSSTSSSSSLPAAATALPTSTSVSVFFNSRPAPKASGLTADAVSTDCDFLSPSGNLGISILDGTHIPVNLQGGANAAAAAAMSKLQTDAALASIAAARIDPILQLSPLTLMALDSLANSSATAGEGEGLEGSGVDLSSSSSRKSINFGADVASVPVTIPTPFPLALRPSTPASSQSPSLCPISEESVTCSNVDVFWSAGVASNAAGPTSGGITFQISPRPLLPVGCHPASPLPASFSAASHSRAIGGIPPMETCASHVAKLLHMHSSSATNIKKGLGGMAHAAAYASINNSTAESAAVKTEKGGSGAASSSSSSDSVSSSLYNEYSGILSLSSSLPEVSLSLAHAATAPVANEDASGASSITHRPVSSSSFASSARLLLPPILYNSSSSSSMKVASPLPIASSVSSKVLCCPTGVFHPLRLTIGGEDVARAASEGAATIQGIRILTLFASVVTLSAEGYPETNPSISSMGIAIRIPAATRLALSDGSIVPADSKAAGLERDKEGRTEDGDPVILFRSFVGAGSGNTRIVSPSTGGQHQGQGQPLRVVGIVLDAVADATEIKLAACCNPLSGTAASRARCVLTSEVLSFFSSNSDSTNSSSSSSSGVVQQHKLPDFVSSFSGPHPSLPPLHSRRHTTLDFFPTMTVVGVTAVAPLHRPRLAYSQAAVKAIRGVGSDSSKTGGGDTAFSVMPLSKQLPPQFAVGGSNTESFSASSSSSVASVAVEAGERFAISVRIKNSSPGPLRLLNARLHRDTIKSDASSAFSAISACVLHTTDADIQNQLGVQQIAVSGVVKTPPVSSGVNATISSALSSMHLPSHIAAALAGTAHISISHKESASTASRSVSSPMLAAGSEVGIVIEGTSPSLPDRISTGSPLALGCIILDWEESLSSEMGSSLLPLPSIVPHIYPLSASLHFPNTASLGAQVAMTLSLKNSTAHVQVLQVRLQHPSLPPSVQEVGPPRGGFASPSKSLSTSALSPIGIALERSPSLQSMSSPGMVGSARSPALSLPVVLGGGGAVSSPLLSSPVIGGGVNSQRRSMGMAPLLSSSDMQSPSAAAAAAAAASALNAPTLSSTSLGLVVVGGAPADSHLQILPGESDTLTWLLSLTGLGPQDLPYVTVKSVIAASGSDGGASTASSSSSSSSSSASSTASAVPLPPPTLPSSHALLTGSSLQVGPNPTMLEDGAAQAIVFSDMLLSSAPLPSLAGQTQPYFEERRWVESTEAPLLSFGGRSAFSIFVVD